MERLNHPRLTIDLTELQDKKLRDLIPWGQKKALFYTIIDELILILEALEPSDRSVALSAICAKRVSILDLLREGEKKKAKKVKKNETP